MKNSTTAKEILNDLRLEHAYLGIMGTYELMKTAQSHKGLQRVLLAAGLTGGTVFSVAILAIADLLGWLDVLVGYTGPGAVGFGVLLAFSAIASLVVVRFLSGLHTVEKELVLSVIESQLEYCNLIEARANQYLTKQELDPNAKYALMLEIGQFLNPVLECKKFLYEE